jgi:DNA-binding MarR family transcriptional regulator
MDSCDLSISALPGRLRDALLESAEPQPSHAAYLALTQVSAALQQQVAALLAEHGLSLTQYSALRAVRRLQGCATLASLGAAMVHRAPDLSRLADRLERAGLIERVAVAGDRRAVHLVLTCQGTALLVAISQPLKELHEWQFEALGMEELQNFVAHLAAVADGMNID